jgi:phosphorylase/glycogen(starch) synthase
MNRYHALSANNNENVKVLLKWREDVLSAWNEIECVGVDYTKNEKSTYSVGDLLECRLDIRLGNLNPKDVKIELVFVTPEDHGKRPKLEFKVPFVFEVEHNGIYSFISRKTAQRIGMWDCAVRVIPSHELLPHDQDFNIVRWI